MESKINAQTPQPVCPAEEEVAPMEFSYEELGIALARLRNQQGMTQRDLEEKSGSRLKQAAISEAENGNKRLPLDRFVEFCNLLGVRADELLDPYLSTPPAGEHSEAIVDSYVIAMAELMQGCPPNVKETMVEVCQSIREQFELYEERNMRLARRCKKLEEQLRKGDYEV